jgi:hypothetical protein
MAILPRRPLKVRFSVRLRAWAAAGLLALAGLAILGAASWFQGGALVHLVRERSIWAHGTPAADSGVQGKRRTTNAIYNHYTLDVSWEDDDGELHAGKLDFSTLLGRVDTEPEPEVRYDPKEPDRFALNWAIDATGSRLGEIVVSWALFALLGLILVRRMRVPLAELAEIRHCAEYADEVELIVLGIEPVVQKGRPTAAHRWRFQVAGTSERGEVLVRKNLRPLYADAAGTRVLAPRSRLQPDRPVILDESLAPFDFNAGEAHVIRKRLDERRRAAA